MKGVIIAGTNSGCGKTTITMGLMSFFAKHFFRVAPFKTGPDYIDPAFHAIAAQTTSYNLDSHLLTPEVVRALFNKHTADKDIAIVEGVMGLYDGLGDDGFGSTAQLAKILNLPVVLVVNCKAMHQSIAALILGFKQFDPAVNIAGVLLNNLSSETHFDFLKQYIERTVAIPVVGYLPNAKQVIMESRHLGLIQAQEQEGLSEILENLRAFFNRTIDLELFLKITQLETTQQSQQPLNSWKRNLTGLRLGVARDLAFQFYYQDNIELLLENGAEIHYFSPLNDEQIPSHVNALYLGGGYPEVFAQALSDNKTMRESIHRSAANGMPIYAECGGLMYLTQGITTLDNQHFEMCGIFHLHAQMKKTLQRFGYCQVQWNEANTRSHEFHRSTLLPLQHNHHHEFTISKPNRPEQWQGGLRQWNVLAGYPHIHFYSDNTFYNKIIDLWTQQNTQ